MNGLWIKENQHFAVLLDSLLPEFEPLWWFCSIQSCPVSGRWLYGNEETGDPSHEEIYDECFFDAKCLRQRDAWVWRPGTLPMLAPHIYLDEWSTLIGFKADESEVERIAAELLAHGHNSAQDFSVIERFAEIYILDIDDGLFHVYSPHEEWLQRLHFRWPNAENVEWNKWWRDWQAELQREMEEYKKLTKL